ncbi:MAG: IscS subfamily cysteine desulfurase [Planctomycetes bacterium]|nr:IscS subfamily cysteine desulfurase [Planctomycetota bacterium]
MRIYLDNHATTPCDPRVVRAMLPYFTEKCGNAASKDHIFGKEAEQAVEAARRQIAALLKADEGEIVFTSGATESDNLAIKGVLEAYGSKGRHIVTVATEHKAVLETCKALEEAGRAQVTVLPVDSTGLIDPDRLAAAITEQTVLVSVMFANNEIGTIQPIAEIGRLCAQRNVFFHSDAAQAAGRIPIDVEAMNLHLVSLSGHKMYGPKGVGALYVRKRHPRVKLRPMIDGGGHERGLRSGTLPVPLVVGFGLAAEIAAKEMSEEARRILSLRERLRRGLFESLDGLTLNGHPERRLPGNLHVSFACVEADSLMTELGEIAVSSGAACASATLQPSHVLRAIGVSEVLAHDSIRFGVGRFNTRDEIDVTLDRTVRVVRRLRERSPLYGRMTEHV